jgi:acetyl-CoA synthetase
MEEKGEKAVIAEGRRNIGYICTRQQCENGLGDKVAFRFLPAAGKPLDCTFSDLDRRTGRFANVLRGLGFASGEILFTYLPKCPEQFYCFLGALKGKVICGTLFSNFGDEALLDRLGDSGAKGLVTRKSFLKKIERIQGRLPRLEHILVTDIDDHLSEKILSLPVLMAAASEDFDVPPTTPDTPSVLHYTSGSTGKPKGVLHVHGSASLLRATSRDVLQLGPDDIFWCTADQGWVTGTSYGIIGPWSLGATQIHYGGIYDAARWFEILRDEKVTVWYSAPTALRMLMREGDGFFAKYDLSRLKYIFSVGEPLNPEVIVWARANLGRDIYDTWFQTETGSIMIANRPGLEVRPGSMGKPVDSIEPAILSDDGTPVADGESGNLCLKAGWPSMFLAYLNNESAYRKKFVDGYYLSGDTAVRDRDGYYWFKGRSDDVINTGGHLISPFEVESALLEMAEVAESAVIGAPDDLLFEKVVAFVHLREGYVPSRELEIRIRLHISNRVSSIATPQDMFFVERIPKNKSGKIMRRVLKARYLGSDEGDTSTLED